MNHNDDDDDDAEAGVAVENMLVKQKPGVYGMFVQALIGTYRCTDVPGQFVWQPGSLLCAVTDGHWLLLEDVDSAPMDIVSVLVPLLETGTLSVPGHGGEVPANPNFRIFATRRYGLPAQRYLCLLKTFLMMETVMPVCDL